MAAKKNYIKLALFKFLGFEKYLSLLSQLYFIAYKIGVLKFSKAYQYHYYLKKIIKKGDTIIDIGANLGYYSVLFAKWTGPSGMVHSVEPVPPVFKILKKNVRNFQNVVLYPIALGGENKAIQMANNSKAEYGYITSGRNFVNTGVDSRKDLVLFNAEMKRGSELFHSLSRIDFIKCDVEGFELPVIQDMLPLITRFTPTMLIETEGENRTFIYQQLSQVGYSALVLSNNLLTPLSEFSGSSADVLFIHSSRLSAI